MLFANDIGLIDEIQVRINSTVVTFQICLMEVGWLKLAHNFKEKGVELRKVFEEREND